MGGDEQLKVLVVDCDAVAVRSLSATLRREGCHPLEATSFEEARRLWAAERPPMVIADLRLGQFNGIQLLLRARTDRPDVTVLITSPIPDRVLEADTRRFGGTFLVKPLQHEFVVRVLKSLRPAALATWQPSERRSGERRRDQIPSFTPNRRIADRRRPIAS